MLASVWMPGMLTVQGSVSAAVSLLITGFTHAVSQLLWLKPEADYAPVCNIEANSVWLISSPHTNSMACCVICISDVCSWNCVLVCVLCVSTQSSCILSSRLDAWVGLNHLKLLQFFWVSLANYLNRFELIYFIECAYWIVEFSLNFCILLNKSAAWFVSRETTALCWEGLLCYLGHLQFLRIIVLFSKPNGLSGSL
jgi:hypothetical protein